MSKNVLLISVTAIKERSSVHLNVDDKLIMPEIKTAQDIEIVPALGSALFSRLQAGIAAGDLTADEQTLLDEYVADTLVNYVLAALPMSTSFQVFSKGTVRRNSDNTELPSMGDLVDVSNFYRNRGEYYRERLIRYLGTNGSKYAQYAAGSCDGTAPAQSGYTLPCDLSDYYGDDDC